MKVDERLSDIVPAPIEVEVEFIEDGEDIDDKELELEDVKDNK